MLVAGVAVGDQVPGERGRDRGGDAALAAGADGLQECQPPVRGPGDQHVRRPGRGLAVLLLRVRLVLSPAPAPRPERTVRPARSPGSRRRPARPRPASAASIASSNPAFPSCAFTRAAALSTQPAETVDAEQHADDLRGPLRRHVPVTRQQHRGRVQRRPVGHRARVRPGGGSANVTVPQHGHGKPGSAHSVTFRANSTSMTCAHRGSTASPPSRDARQDRHSAGGAASFFSPGSGSRFRPFPSWPGCPPLLRSLLRSRSDCCRARQPPQPHRTRAESMLNLD